MSATPADLMRQYHAAKRNGAEPIALAALWREYIAAIEREMAKKSSDKERHTA